MSFGLISLIGFLTVKGLVNGTINRQNRITSYNVCYTKLLRVTIKDVAKKAGTSTATVSKVMNNSYSISQPTIDRVKAAMEELKYHPNLQARNFAKKSTQAIIFATQLGQNIGFSNPHMFEMMSGLEQALANKGYTVITSYSIHYTKLYEVAEVLAESLKTLEPDIVVVLEKKSNMTEALKTVGNDPNVASYNFV